MLEILPPCIETVWDATNAVGVAFGFTEKNADHFIHQLPKGYHDYRALTDALNPLNPADSPGGYRSGRLEERGWFNPLRYIDFGTAAGTAGFNPGNPAYPMPLQTADGAGRAAEGERRMGPAPGRFFPHSLQDGQAVQPPRNY